MAHLFFKNNSPAMITLSPNVHKNLEISWGFDRNKHGIHPVDLLNSRQYPTSDYGRKYIFLSPNFPARSFPPKLDLEVYCLVITVKALLQK